MWLELYCYLELMSNNNIYFINWSIRLGNKSDLLSIK